MKKRPTFPAQMNFGSDQAPPDVLLSATKVMTPSNQRGMDKTPKPFVPLNQPSGIGLDSIAVRHRMVDKLLAQGLDDEMVLNAMRKVERHRFVDTALVNQAYEDTSLPIGLGQTISKPNVVARMICLLRQGRNLLITGKMNRVLEIGTGCGYQAALLAEVSKEVYSVERLKGLHDKAVQNLKSLELKNVHLIFGDGMLGHPSRGPYSGIISAAGGDTLPQTWIDQLDIGGRIVAPWAQDGAQSLLVIDKTVKGLERQVLEPVHFVPLKSGVA
jgi:protein-L-isoaspartate(D-aspartate) O-methyltransferase